MPVDCTEEIHHSVRKAAFQFVKEKTEQTFAKSNIVDCSNVYPKFTIDEIKLGKTLGKGNFGIVYECLGFTRTERCTHRKEISSLFSASENTASMSCDEEIYGDGVQSRGFMADHCIREGGSSRYAVKMLQEDTTKCPGMLIRGSIDMALETRILSSICHPNIIKLHACGATSPYKADYFIVIDRLIDTLDQRIEKWAKQQKYVNSTLGRKLLDRKGKRRIALLEDKLTTALDLSAAFEYLHSKNILFRDLKPGTSNHIEFDMTFVFLEF